MQMRKTIFLVMLLALTTEMSTAATIEGDTTRRDRLNYKTLNFLSNPWSGTNNPVSLSFNQVQTLAQATLLAHYERGGYHPVDGGAMQNDYSLDISGLKRIGNFSLSGNIKYSNIKDYSRRWNSTLYLTPLNPFVFGDSIRSDMTTEQFDLHAAAAYRFSDRVQAGLRLRYLTGSLSDQTDPRPKNNAMHFIITPGFFYRLSDSHALGASLNFDIYRSSLTHVVINNYINNIYFLMRGMGDSQNFTTNDALNYPRDYKGFRFGGSLQWQWDLSDAIGNMLELSGATNSEKATDGGSAYTYKGGDYKATTLGLYDRLSIGGSGRLRHNVSLRGSYNGDEGYWYYQRRMTDHDHSNRVYYEVLSKNKMHKSTRLAASAVYRLDALDTEALPSWTVQGGVGLNYSDEKHFEESTSEQKYTLIDLAAEGTKYWRLRRLRLTTTAGGGYRFSVGDPTFASVRGKLLSQYTAPAFEYATANTASVNARAALDIPLRLYSTPTWLTVFAGGQWRIYSGEDSNKYSNAYEGDCRTLINIGASLTL